MAPYLFDSCFDDSVQFVSSDELPPTAGHVALEYRNSMIVWGGYFYDQEGHYYRRPDYLYVYPFSLLDNAGVWIKYRVNKGNVPPSMTAASGLMYKDVMYLFAGNVLVNDATDGARTSSTQTNSLYYLNMITGEWSAYTQSPGDLVPTPRDKACGFATEDGLFFFGGYGPAHRQLHRSSSYLFSCDDYFEDEDLGNSCWNNQLLCFDWNKWSLVKQCGNIPSHRAAANIVYVEKEHKAYLFGGRHSTVRLNDLYELDLTAMRWTKINFEEDCPTPIGRSWATLTYNPEGSFLFLYGGFSVEGEPLADRLKLTIEPAAKSCKCEPVQVPLTEVEKRLWHTTVYISGAFINYGGLYRPPSTKDPFIGSLDVNRVSPPSLLALAMRRLSKKNGKFVNPTYLPYILKSKFVTVRAMYDFKERVERLPKLTQEFLPNQKVYEEVYASRFWRVLPQISLPVLFNALDI